MNVPKAADSLGVNTIRMRYATAIVGGMLMVLLGFIGVYVGYIFQEVKRRPVYIVKKGDKENE